MVISWTAAGWASWPGASAWSKISARRIAVAGLALRGHALAARAHPPESRGSTIFEILSCFVCSNCAFCFQPFDAFLELSHRPCPIFRPSLFLHHPHQPVELRRPALEL